MNVDPDALYKLASLMQRQRQIELAEKANELLTSNSSSTLPKRQIDSKSYLKPGFRTICPYCKERGEPDPNKVYLVCARC